MVRYFWRSQGVSSSLWNIAREMLLNKILHLYLVTGYLKSQILWLKCSRYYIILLQHFISEAKIALETSNCCRVTYFVKYTIRQEINESSKNWEVLEGDHRILEFRETAVLAINCKSPWPAHTRQATLVLSMTGMRVPYEIKSKKGSKYKANHSTPFKSTYLHS